MRKILHLSGGDHLNSGMHTALLQVISLLDQENIKQAMVCGNETAAKITEPWMKKTVVGKFYNPLTDLKSYYKLHRFISDFQPDIIQVWSNKIARFLWPKPKCSVVTYRGSNPDTRLINRLKNTSDAFIVPSSDMELYLRDNGFINHPVHVINHYADIMPATPYPREDFPNPTTPLILAGGRMVSGKGFDLLLNSAAKLTCPFHLLLAGTGPEEERLKNLVSTLNINDKVTFLGWRDDFKRLLATSDIVAIPSIYEPFGLIVIEAMSQNTAVIVSDASGPKGIVSQCPESAIMLPAEDEQQWTQALQKLLTDPNQRAKLAKNGNDFVKQYYDPEQTKRQLMRFYEGLG